MARSSASHVAGAGRHGGGAGLGGRRHRGLVVVGGVGVGRILPRWMVNESALRRRVLCVCVQWRAVRNAGGSVWFRRLSMGADTKACSRRSGAPSRANCPLWVVERCVVCLSSNCEQVWFLSGDRGAIFGGACVGVRERKHLRSKKYTKNRWALLRITTATQ